MINKIIAIILLIASKQLYAQTLSVENYIAQVKKYHPIAKQAQIIMQVADANLMNANGAFDPIIDIDGSQKKLQGVQYYSYANPEIKYNSPIGIGVKTGIETIGGTYANSELTQGTSSYAGIELQLLKGLLIDKNRAALRNAKIMQQQSVQENNAMLNNLLIDAYNSYWQWAAQYQLYQIFGGYVQNAKQRFELIKLAYVNGDRAQADTVEALTQLQSFELMQTDALLQLQKASIDVSQYLWAENDKPETLQNSIIPDVNAFVKLKEIQTADQLIEAIAKTNPELKIYDYKLQQLEVEKKLKSQNRLPTLNVQANALNKNSVGSVNNSLIDVRNNNKFGVQFKVPILLREARGEYQQSILKIKNTKWQQDYKNWELQNKIKQYTTTTNLLQTQLNQIEAMIGNYQFLVNNENLKFAQGETTIFLINTREIKLLEMQQKQIELRVKYLKAYYATIWASGLLQ